MVCIERRPAPEWSGSFWCPIKPTRERGANSKNHTHRGDLHLSLEGIGILWRSTGESSSCLFILGVYLVQAASSSAPALIFRKSLMKYHLPFPATVSSSEQGADTNILFSSLTHWIRSGNYTLIYVCNKHANDANSAFTKTSSTI